MPEHKYRNGKLILRTDAGQLLSNKRLFPDKCERCNTSHMKIKEHNQTIKHLETYKPKIYAVVKGRLIEVDNPRFIPEPE